MFENMDKNFVLPTYGRNYVNFVKGEGATLYDSDDKSYIDFTAGIGVVSVGHANEEVSEVICNQVKKITHISNLYLIEPQAKLAQELVMQSGYDMKVFFSNSGAEANEGALKIARKYGEVDGKPKRYKIITLKHSFHGRTISTLKATGQEAMHNYFGPFPDGFVYADSIEDIESLLDEHTIGVMIELVQGEGGVEPQDRDDVQRLAELLKKRDILLIVDEVQTGIYRTGEMFASNLYDITPDIITVAKGLGGGVPIGAVMSGKKDVLKAGDHGSTYGGNYLVTAASLKVLEILKEQKSSGKLDKRVELFSKHIDLLTLKYPNIIDKSVGVGLMVGVRIKDADILATIIKSSFESGLLVLKAGRNTLRFLPPLTISDKEIEVGFKILNTVFSKLKPLS
jgi:acetylornithine aminotransferase